jgi:hypothetical protein
MKQQQQSPVPTLYSGGAEGADYRFTFCALKADHAIRIASFIGHKTILPPNKPNKDIVVLNFNQYKTHLADISLNNANKKLCRRVPQPGYVLKLLQRNYDQIATVSSLFAIGFFDISNGRDDCVRIQGGTAWACQMFCDRWVDGQDKRIPLFFFCQTAGAWFQCQLKGYSVTWDRMEKNVIPPKPIGKYAGIGTRELNPNGMKAIDQLFDVDIVESPTPEKNGEN